MAPKILYLHSLRSKRDNDRQKQLEEVLGKEHLIAPDLRTAKTVWITLAVMVLIALILTAATTLSYFKFPLWGALTTTAVAVLGGATSEFLLLRGMLSIMLSRAIRIATDAYDRGEVNLIVSDGFGAVVARRIPRPKPPMLLFVPALERYAKFCGDKSHRRLDTYPYVLIVHENKSKSIPVNDSFRTIERADPARSRLEILELSSRKKNITNAELKAFIEEVYASGKAAVKTLSEAAEAHEIITIADFDSADE